MRQTVAVCTVFDLGRFHGTVYPIKADDRHMTMTICEVLTGEGETALEGPEVARLPRRRLCASFPPKPHTATNFSAENTPRVISHSCGQNVQRGRRGGKKTGALKSKGERRKLLN